MDMHAFDARTNASLEPMQRYLACKAMARGYAESKKTERNRLAHARSFCASVVAAYWNALCERNRSKLKIVPAPLSLPKVGVDVQHIAGCMGRLVAEFPAEDAGYLIGSIYTAMLPASLRSSLGAYYTPPPLVTRLLDLAEEAGFDFSTGTAIDPACGGGAFLAPVALRMISHAGDASPDWILRRLGKRLKGVEVDPFAAWMTRVLVEAAVMPLCIQAKRRLADVVIVGDALRPRDIGTFDLVIGNPPYGRTKLDAATRGLYSRSLFGHANLYGLFTDLALRLCKPNGVVAYLTPTSFLGGQYFKALRTLLTTEASPVAFDFVSDRNGVFDDVLQETMLTTYIRKQGISQAAVSTLIPQGLNAARSEQIGKIEVPGAGDPWLLPRAAKDAAFLDRLNAMPTRLSDLGYVVSTGQLVWNRHKDQLRTERGQQTLPLVWAECVTPSGFSFSAERRSHVPYIATRTDQQHLITRAPCVLLQRTTSKEQHRRLVAALLPQSFLDEYGGAVIENHLNIIQADALKFRVSPQTIVALLNSEAADRAFRCISGSVAVSAYELGALPVPSVEQMDHIEKLVVGNADRRLVERAIAACYGEA